MARLALILLGKYKLLPLIIILIVHLIYACTNKDNLIVKDGDLCLILKKFNKYRNNIQCFTLVKRYVYLLYTHIYLLWEKRGKCNPYILWSKWHINLLNFSKAYSVSVYALSHIFSQIVSVTTKNPI